VDGSGVFGRANHAATKWEKVTEELKTRKHTKRKRRKQVQRNSNGIRRRMPIDGDTSEVVWAWLVSQR
jgi:hypothetical protein